MRLFPTLLAGAVAMMPGATGAVQSEPNRMIWVYNRTAQPIYNLYTSSSDSGVWNEGEDDDLLGDQVLMPNRRIAIDMDDGTGECTFDFKAVLRSGRAMTKWNINVCRAASITFGSRNA